jgi:hypothetical protein
MGMSLAGGVRTRIELARARDIPASAERLPLLRRRDQSAMHGRTSGGEEEERRKQGVVGREEESRE